MVKVKNKKRNLAEATSKKRDQQQKKKSTNPFEVHINKEKHKVLGRKNKADRGLPGVARAKAINKRKSTLLHEYKVKDKDNAFLDRRIGERNSAMTQEDKIMARFAAERMRAHTKKSIFNLNDDETLTHGGQTLEDIEKFEDPKSDDEEFSDDENKTGKLDKKFVSEAHFGGGVLSRPDAPLSRKDLIEQLISESKKRKAEKQKIREQTIDLTDKLDTEWKDLLPIVSASKKTAEERNEKMKSDDYDIALRELKFEARGTPSDRLKSEEEIAKDEKEKLEELEADRLARMKGFTEDSNARTKHKSADDLDDGFAMEDINEHTLTYGEDGLVNGVKEKEHDSNEESGEETGSTDDEAKSDDEHSQNEKVKVATANDSSEEEDNSEADEKPNKLDKKKKSSREDNNSLKNAMKGITVDLKTIENDPYKDIPVLKISDDTEESKSKNDKNQKSGDKKAIADEDVSRLKKFKEKNKLKTAEPESDEDSEIDNEDAEDDSEAEKNSENSDEEDNLSDLKESESSSEDEEPSSERKVKFSTVLEGSKTVSKTPSQVQPKSILKSKKEVDAGPEKLSGEDRTKQIKADLQKRKEIMEKARQELPYTYKAPESFEDLQKLLQDQNPDYQSVIVERIIKCNHQSLGEGNKEKLSNLFAYLLQHFNDCAIEDENESIIKCFQIFDRLCPHLYDLAHANPENAKFCIQEVMKEKHEEFEKNKKRYPGLDTLIFFKLVALLFPTSDYRHAVVTPTLVFMSQILLRCRVRNRSAIAKGLFISTLVLEYTLLSKRFAPSVINFLRGIVHMATPKSLVQVIKVIPPFKSIGQLSNLLIPTEDQTDLVVCPKSNLMKATDLVEEELDDDFKARAFLTAVNLISEFTSQLEELDAAFSIFEPIVKLLRINSLDNYPENVKEHVANILKDLESLRDKKLEYIAVEKKKPKALRLYEPRIETVYDGKKHRPMSKEKAEREKLVHKYKREVKGAIREVRRDRVFLAKVQIKQQIKSDEQRKRKVKEIFGDAAMQQGELNEIKRKKGN